MCDSRMPPDSGFPSMWKKSGATSVIDRFGLLPRMTGPTTVSELSSISVSLWK